MSAIHEADTGKPAAVEKAATCALENSYITFPNSKEVTQVNNEAPEVSDHEYDKDFDIDNAESTKTKVDNEETIEDKEVNNNNYFLKMVTRAKMMKKTHHIYDIIPEEDTDLTT